MKRGFVSKHGRERLRVLYEPPGSIKLRQGGETILCDGLLDTGRGVIRIDDGLPPARERETLVHELLHQLIDAPGLDLDGEQEERIVTQLAAAIGAHLAENPGLWAYLLSLAAVVGRRR